MNQRKQLRQQARRARRSLTPQQQRIAGQQLGRILRSQPTVIRSQHIALYLPNDGEIDPTGLLKYLWQLGKRCYLPVLQPFTNKLWFAPYTTGSRMRQNRFGIPEPAVKLRQMRQAKTLCLLLMPLVAFDKLGGRLGMGGGFYDRTLAFKHDTHANSQSPKLIGLAHDCQEVEKIPMETWDIPLDAIATNSRLINTHPNSKEAQRNFRR